MTENGKQALALADGQTPEQVARDAMLWLGRAEAFSSIRMITSVGHGVALRNLRDTPGALKAAGFANFTDACEHFGLSLSSGKELIQNLEAFGETFMTAADGLQLTTRHLRAARALTDGKPEVRGKLLILSGTAYDLEKPRDREKVRDEFEAVARAREREAKKAEKEKAEVAEHGEKQIGALRKKNDALAQQLLDAGFEVGGKRVGAADLIAQSDKLISLAIAKMTAALDGAKAGKKAFHDKICAQVIGLCEQLSRQTTNQSEAAARQLEEYEG